MVKALAAPLSMLLLGACAAYGGPPTGNASACQNIQAREWAAWVNAMPGPGGNRPHLIVTGKVSTPTGGYRLSLAQGPVQEMYPPIQQVILNVDAPDGMATQAIVEHEVRGSFPALDTYGAVTIHCGGRVIATISDIQRAY